MKSLGSRESQARLLLENLRDRNESKAEMLEQKIKQAKNASFHNLALTLKLWNEILGDGFDDSAQNIEGSTEATNK